VTHGYVREDHKQALLTRLKRAEGQVRGLQRMIEEERYCIDILTQIAATRAALDGVALEVLKDHVLHCSCDARVGAVARRARLTFTASRSWSTIRSVASSRFRSCERSSCAIARTTGPSRSRTRRRSRAVSAVEPSTSKSASTRVELFCAC